MSQQNIEALNDELQRSIDGLNSEFDKNHQTLLGQIKELNAITDELEHVHKATTVGSLVGSSVGAAGGITALVGFLLAPFTFGVSLALTVGGAVVGVAGGVTGAGSNITNMVKQKTLRETIEKIIIDFLNRIKPMIEHLNTIQKTVEELQKMEETYSLQNKIILTSVRSVKTFSSITKLAIVFNNARIADAAARVVTTFKVVGKLTTAITGLFLILDFYSIACDSTEISEMNQSEKERKEEEIKSETLKFIHRMRKSAARFQEVLGVIECARDGINKELQNI